MTAGGALASAASMLGVRLDAELLLAHVLDVPRASVIARDDRELTPEELGDFERLLARRLRGEPLAYLTGTKEFWSLELEVTPDVLVPRPETELLVEWVLSSPPRTRGASLSVLDIGTGSGALAIAIAKELPQARVVASDVAPAALAVARRNAARVGVGNVEFVESNLFERLDSRFRGNDGLDVIVSNPPYIAEGDPHLADLKFEPAVALTAGADGLDALRAIVAGAPALLAPGGWLLVEHGSTQAAAVRERFARAGFADIETRRDLAGLERATGGRRPPDGSARGQA